MDPLLLTEMDPPAHIGVVRKSHIFARRLKSGFRCRKSLMRLMLDPVCGRFRRRTRQVQSALPLTRIDPLLGRPPCLERENAFSLGGSLLMSRSGSISVSGNGLSQNPRFRIFVENFVASFVENCPFLDKGDDKGCDKGLESRLLGQALFNANER